MHILSLYQIIFLLLCTLVMWVLKLLFLIVNKLTKLTLNILQTFPCTVHLEEVDRLIDILILSNCRHLSLALIGISVLVSKWSLDTQVQMVDTQVKTLSNLYRKFVQGFFVEHGQTMDKLWTCPQNTQCTSLCPKFVNQIIGKSP